jgi:hypothetical protein
LTIDNNAAEQQIRPITLGCKNWLFFGSDKGGRTAAILFSVIQSAKRHGLNTFRYIEWSAPQSDDPGILHASGFGAAGAGGKGGGGDAGGGREVVESKIVRNSFNPIYWEILSWLS